MHKNNFDFLRLLLAIFVIITHSYPLSGILENDWLSQISKQQASFSTIGVWGFFSISGYLIYQSLTRSKTIFEYYWKRILRLFPALFFVLLLTVVLGVFVYNSDFIHYIRNKSVWTYLPLNLSLFRLQFSIDGIFANNPYKSIINGSLWTLSYEFLFYFLISLLFFFKTGMRNLLVCFVFAGLLLSRLFFFKELGKYGFVLSGDHLLSLGTCFFSGSLMASLKTNEWSSMFKIILVISGIIILIVSTYLGYCIPMQVILLPPIVILIGTLSTKYINSLSTTLGDLSYGMYIYAYPVQQTLMHFFKLNYLQLMFAATILSAFFAYLSWHLIEKKALSLKNIVLLR